MLSTRKNTNRFLALVLSVAMLISTIPFSMISFAAEYPDNVTITLKDETDNPIQEKALSVEVKSKENNNTVTKEIKTDKEGVAAVLAKSDYKAGDLTLTVKIPGSGYELITDQDITSDTQNFDIVLSSKTITNVKIEGKTLTYQKDAAQELVLVEAEPGDTVTYTVGSEGPQTAVPVKTDADTYSIKVTVEREGMDKLEKTVQTVIKQADITGIRLSAKQGLKYNKSEQELVTFSGFENTDTVTWKLNGTAYSEATVPAATNAGKYTVAVKVERDANYVPFEKEVEVTVAQDKTILDADIKTLNQVSNPADVYDSTPKDLLEVVNNGSGYELQYRFKGEAETEWTSWSTAIPVATNAGNYSVEVKGVPADALNYAESDVIAYTATIKKADQKIKFTNVSGAETEKTKKANTPFESLTYDFAAEITESLSGNAITYTTDADKSKAEISAEGVLTVYYPGTYKVTATLAGNENCNEVAVTHTIKVKAEPVKAGDALTVNNPIVEYVTGTANGVVSEEKVTKKNKFDTGKITYSIDRADAGIQIDPNTGKITVTDYNALIAGLVNGETTITVTADKAATLFYGADTTTYKVVIKINAVPEGAYTLSSQNGTNGWYKTDAKIQAAEGYQVAYSIKNDAAPEAYFANSADYTTEGDANVNFYIRNSSTGEIYAETAVNIKLDKSVPDTAKMNIVVEEFNIIEKIGQKFGFFRDLVKVKFTVNDEIGAEESGISKISWTYQKKDTTSEVKNGEISVSEMTKDENGYSCVLKLNSADGQLRGNFEFTATDIAGNVSELKTDNGHITVLDNISPVFKKAEHKHADVNGTRTDVDGHFYYDGDVDFTFDINEHNFFEDDCVVTVTKNQDETPVEVAWAENTQDVHTGSFTLKDEGDYVISVKYRNDNSGNKTVDVNGNAYPEYVSEIITIDRTAPELSMKYSKADSSYGTDGEYYKSDIQAELTVVETNFYENDVKVKVVAENGTSYDVKDITWDEGTGNTHKGKFIISEEGHYVIKADYTDKSDNAAAQYVSQRLTVDKTVPVIDVNFTNKGVKNTIKKKNADRNYYDKVQTAEITITEHNFDPECVELRFGPEDVQGNKLSEDLCVISDWTDKGDKHSITVIFDKDANYVFDVDVVDRAMNKAADYSENHITVDQTAPVNLKISYSESVLDKVLEKVSFGYYDAKVKVTVTAEDVTSEIDHFVYSYIKDEKSTCTDPGLHNERISAKDIKYSDNNRVATAHFYIPKDLLNTKTQFNGHVEFSAFDRAENESAKLVDGKMIVIDNIAPTAVVEYNAPVNKHANVSYYAGNINAKITVEEANFFTSDFNLTVTKDDGAYAVTPSWSKTGKNTYVATFTLSADGHYFVSAEYKDRSSNAMKSYKSEELVVDTTISEPVITVNGREADGQSFKDEVVPGVSFNDRNFENCEIKLTRTRYDAQNVDVTSEFVTGISNDGQGGNGNFAAFRKDRKIDGIYTMNVKMSDRAGHTSEKTAMFTVNRFGSVYEYDSYLESLIKEGGAFVKAIDKNIVITEYNPDRLLAGSLDIQITRDGKPLDKADYSVTPAISGNASVGNSGWFQHQYTLNKKNFEKDGIYKIAISSEDATGNSSENTNFEDKKITFRVDSTAPEITSITGLEKDIVNAEEQKVEFTVFDVMGLKNIDVLVNGKKTGNSVTDFGEDPNNYTGSFTIKESFGKQSVQIIVTDMAGNVTDTNSKDFESAFAFNKEITVSTNVFARWLANTPLVIGTVAVVAAVVGGMSYMVIFRKRKAGVKEPDNSKES